MSPSWKSSPKLLELHTYWRSKVKIDQGDSTPEAGNLLRWTVFPADGSRSSLIWNLSLFCLFASCFFSLLMHRETTIIVYYEDLSVIRISQTIATAGSLTNGWICRAKPKSVQEGWEPLFHLVSNLTAIPNATVCLNYSRVSFYKVEILLILTPPFLAST